MIARSMPFFRSPPSLSEIKPTAAGPIEQPTSPDSASSAKSAVPPVGSAFAPMLRLPGHIIPTERPHKAQPIRLSTAFDESDESG